MPIYTDEWVFGGFVTVDRWAFKRTTDMWIEIWAACGDVNQFDPKLLEDSDQLDRFRHIRLWWIIFINTETITIRRWDIPRNPYRRLRILHVSHAIIDIEPGGKEEIVSDLRPNFADDVTDKPGAVLKAAAVLPFSCLGC